MKAANIKTANAYSADCPTRQILDRVGDKWAVLILLLVRHEPMRFNALRRTIEGISQKMLSQVLKSLERDGLTVDVFEIDPEIVRIAEKWFGYAPKGAVTVGDAGIDATKVGGENSAAQWVAAKAPPAKAAGQIIEDEDTNETVEQIIAWLDERKLI